MIEALAAFVSSAKASDLPASDRAILRRHVADVCAARLAGAACSEGKVVAAFYPPGQGVDSIAGLGALVRLTETDDIHMASGVTPGSVAVPVALGLAAAESCSPERLESAIHVGLEIAVRFGMALGGAGVLYHGIWPTRAAATLGAAATACRLWGLTASETRHALSLATILTSGRTGRFHGEPSGRWVIFAAAVSAGLRAAHAARAGYIGDAAVVDAAWIERSVGVPLQVEALVDNLGRASVLGQLSLKPYCTSRQGLPGAEAMRALVARGLDPRDIEAFSIFVPSAYAGMISQKLDPAVRSTAYVSGAALAAMAAIDPDLLFDVDRTKAMGDARVIELARKGQVSADPEFDRLYPARWPARIEVRTRAGLLRHEIVEPFGDPGNPIGDKELEDKMRRVLGHAGRADVFASWLAASARPFESEASVTALARCFVDGAFPARYVT